MDAIQNGIENGSDVKLHVKNKNLAFARSLEQMWIMDVSTPSNKSYNNLTSVYHCYWDFILQFSFCGFIFQATG